MKKPILSIFTILLITAAQAQSVSTAAGINGNAGYMPYNGSLTSVPIAGPYGIAVDTGGYVYFSDNLNHRISIIDFAGAAIYNKCGYIGDPSLGGADYINLNGSNARFNAPSGMVINQNNELYICDYNNNAIRKVSITGSVSQALTPSTFAGEDQTQNPTGGYQDGTGTNARFDGPIDIAVDGNGNFYVADNWNECIRKITPSGVVTTLAGKAGQNGDVDSTGTNARFNNILAVEMLDNNFLLVADSYNDKIRKVNVNTGEVSTFAGSGTTGHQDGPAATAKFNAPSGLAVDAYGNVYVAEGGSSQANTIRMISSTGTVSTIAGAYQDATKYLDGPGTDARFYQPTHMAFSHDKSILYVCDLGNNVIRAIDLKPIPRFSATPTTTNTGVPILITDHSMGNPTSWTWEITPNSGYTMLNGTTLNSQNPELKFSVANTYTVKLTVTNPWGTQDTTRNNYLNISNINTTDPPVANFVASDSNIVVNDVVTFTDLSLNSPNQWDWAILPNSFQFVNSTSKTSQNPSVKFTGTGSYTVVLKATNNNGSDVMSKSGYIQVDPLGIQQVTLNELVKVYPNPNNGSFQIQFDANFEHQGLQVFICDMSGKEIRQLSMSQNVLQVDGLQAGIYLVHVSDGSSSYNQKVVVK
ncbi:MAG: T9SS type A sorting domain-containing protein [Bacteroidetes bacterium]|nr:T9SS type A sorting domain-containing protein [Bacteroidota bacterium]